MIFFFVHGFILATSLKINSKKLIQLQKTSTKTEVEGSERTWDNGAGEILKRIHIPFYPKNVGRRLITGRENPENCGEVENPENCGLLENLENCGLLENLVNCGVLENLENCEVLETLEFGEVRVRLWVPPCPGLSFSIAGCVVCIVLSCIQVFLASLVSVLAMSLSVTLCQVLGLDLRGFVVE